MQQSPPLALQPVEELIVALLSVGRRPAWTFLLSQDHSPRLFTADLITLINV